MKVFEFFSQDRVLERFVVQFFEDEVVEEIFKVFLHVGVWVQQRFMEEKHEATTCVLLVRSLAWVWWRHSPT